MTTNDAFAQVGAAARVILDICSSADAVHTKLERVRYASAVIQNLANEALKLVENEQAIIKSGTTGARNG